MEKESAQEGKGNRSGKWDRERRIEMGMASERHSGRVAHMEKEQDMERELGRHWQRESTNRKGHGKGNQKGTGTLKGTGTGKGT